MQRRSIAILASLVVGAGALVAAPASAAPPDRGDGVAYVALGDSEAAGTGNLPYADSACLRSRKAYPERLARMLGTEVVSVACAGADTEDVVAPQVGALGADTELVTITVGVNDLEWLDVIAACGAGGGAVLCAEAQAAAFAALAALPAEYAEMLLEVRAHAPNARIYVAGYPLLFGDLVSGSCDAGGGLVFSAAETQFINGAIQLLNRAIAGGVSLFEAMGGTGVAYVDVTRHFDGHGLCDTGERWISGVVSGRPVDDRGLHLNPPGMREYAEVLASAIEG